MSETRERLRIAIQKSGRLSESSIDLLAKCGLKFRTSRDKLFCFGESLPIDLLLVRDDDIPGLIDQGVCELGIVGRNVAREYSAGQPSEALKWQELANLGFGPCRLSIAIPSDEPYTGPQQLAGKRIATSYPNLLRDYLERHAVSASIVLLNGAVEIAPKLGTADYICDLVSSGATLQANQLREVAVMLQSEAVLIGTRQEFVDARGPLLDTLLRRLEGILRVRESKLLMFQSPRPLLPSLLRLLPDADLPQVSRIDGLEDALGVQVVCHQAITWPLLEDLKRQGASQLLVLPVEKMLA